ncbi:MAG: thioredoxin family protein [Gammaproteobacteria bacterium]|nr:thioredoxin family protein [Gammaproteobacteria bacterium]MCW8841132.1 thioredoxin family protein [Gammaproteobacteria bacterium]MCW8928178.1 thioredoxin family protein [Gammaproteobacteria bacterium]MCW8959359.1 thioredoxin family protein [Gammaproteobacteria bacterium]MCW8973529.1 thioredoxin family protein [Gammaproteobacteria bacterium]
MARTPSTMLELGTPAPDFSLPEPATGKTISLRDSAGSPLVVVFICNHCPYVLHIAAKLAEVAKEFQQRGVEFVAINSNDVANYLDDSPEKMPAFSEKFGLTFPYLFDETQVVASAYRAACTPDFYLFDADHRLVYRGQFDDARPRSDTPVTGADLGEAINALLANRPPLDGQKPSLGCNIKWRPGNEPDYFG